MRAFDYVNSVDEMVVAVMTYMKKPTIDNRKEVFKHISKYHAMYKQIKNRYNRTQTLFSTNG